MTVGAVESQYKMALSKGCLSWGFIIRKFGQIFTFIPLKIIPWYVEFLNHYLHVVVTIITNIDRYFCI